MAEPVILPRMTSNHRIGMKKEGRKFAQKRRKNSQLLTELMGVLRSSEGVDKPMESIHGGVDLKYPGSHRLGGILLAVDRVPPRCQATARFQVLKAHLFLPCPLLRSTPKPSPPQSFLFSRKTEEISPRKNRKGRSEERKTRILPINREFWENYGEFRAQEGPRIEARL